MTAPDNRPSSAGGNLALMRDDKQAIQS